MINLKNKTKQTIMSLTKQQKTDNATYFLNQIRIINEGGTYSWLDEQETYIIKGGKMYATSQNGYNRICDITPYKFSKQYIRPATKFG